METLELKPCPFCGSENRYIPVLNDGRAVQCLYCYAMGPIVETSKLATEKWNARAEVKADVEFEIDYSDVEARSHPVIPDGINWLEVKAEKGATE